MNRLIGRYEIQALIGHGGFGQVFRAFDPTVGRLVAIKTITAAGDAELIRRFRNEAAAAGRLQHQNIVIIYDFGEHEGAPFLVMELLDGEDLDKVIRSGRNLTLLEKLDVISQSANGLRHAHSSGIVHRDVKPANIMLQRDGVVKIMDFGIALLTQATAARLTLTGEIPGTVAFMAPEQLSAGAASDSLTDIFSFGVTCYKILTGSHPFQADNLGTTIYNIITRPAQPLRALTPECPEALEQAVMRMLAKDRDSRYQTLDDVRFDLDPIITDLKRERVQDLVAGARAMIVESQFEPANAMLRNALEADPGNRSARELWDQLQRHLRGSESRPKVAALVQEGRERMQARQFDDAAQKFESALRLDNSNPELHKLIAEAQSAKHRADRASGLIARAQTSLTGGDLTAAQGLVREALSVDPQNAKAIQIEAEVKNRAGQRDRDRRLEEELGQARRLVLLESFEEAAERLQKVVEAFPESTAARDLLARAQKERREREGRQRLQKAAEDGKTRIKTGQFAQALEALAAARAEFPDSKELRDLALFAEEELAAERQAEAVATNTAEAQRLVGEQRFEDALRTLRAALAEYPGASALRDAIQLTSAAKSQHERQTALREAEAQAKSLLEKKRFREASDRIDGFTREYGASPELDDLRKEVDRGLAARKVADNARTLIEEGKADSASQLLQTAMLQFPTDPDLRRLLDEASKRMAQQQAAETISQIIAEVESLARGGQFERALEVLDKGLRDHPKAERLERCRQATQAAQARRRKEQGVQRTVERARELRRIGKNVEAMAEIDGALLDGGDYPELQALRAEIERERSGQALVLLRTQERQRVLDDLRRRVSSLRQSGKIAEALEAIAAVWEQVSTDAEIAALRAQLKVEQEAAQREERFRALLKRAEGLLSADRAGETIALLENAAEFAGRPTLVELVGRARERIAAQEQERAVTGAEVVIRRLSDAGKYAEAFHAIDVALQRYPGTDRLAELRRSIAADQARTDAIEKACSEGEALLRTGRSEAVLQLIAPLEAKYPGETRLIDLRNRALEVARNAAREDQARARLQEIEQRLSATPKGKLKALAVEAKRIAAADGANRELAAIAERIQQQVNALLAAAPSRPWPKRWIAVGVSALALASAAVMLLPRLYHLPTPPPKPATFVLQVRTDPEGSNVSVNGQSCHEATCRFDLPASTYTVRAERPGYRPAERSVALSAAANAGLVTLSLEPEAPPPPPVGAQTGVLLIRTGMAGARVLVDNRPQGLTGARGELSAKVEAGQHSVRVEKAGYRTPPGQQVAVLAGRTLPVQFELTTEMGQLQIHGAPAGAELRLGSGNPAKTDGSPTFQIPAPPGDQVLQVKDADGVKGTPVRIEAGAPLRVEWASIAPAKVLQKPPEPSAEFRENQEWERARKSGDPGLIDAFLRAHPDSRFSTDARSLLDEMAWTRTNQSSAPSLQDYAARFPRGAHAGEAQRVLGDLAWNVVKKDDSAALRTFIDQNSTNAHKPEAQAMLDKLNAPHPVPPQVSPEAPAVREAIDRFNAAFLHRSLKDLKRIWPSPPPNWQDSIQQKSAISIPTLYPSGQPDIKDDQASWHCELTVQNIVRGQPQAPERKKVTVTLRKSAGGWLIQSLALSQE